MRPRAAVALARLAPLLLPLLAACSRGAPAPESRAPGMRKAAASGAGGAGAAGLRADAARNDTALVVRVLDVGQGDATLVTNGGSRVLIDGGPDPRRLGRLLDSLDLNGETIDVVVLSHPHSDHYRGLQALFETRRSIRVRYVFESRDLSPNATLATLRDSISARVRRGETIVRDSDDPCATGAPLCTITLRGGAKLHVLRPDPAARGPNDRSTPVKLVGPDSASFTMWLGGDAERDALVWFDRAADYDLRPGMDVHVLKADHHGSCNGVTARLLALASPEWVVVSLGGDNDYGHMHEQTKRLLRARGIPWYRTDRNGTITIRSPGTPGGGYTIAPQRGTASMDGASDRRSRSRECRGM